MSLMFLFIKSMNNIFGGHTTGAGRCISRLCGSKGHNGSFLGFEEVSVYSGGVLGGYIALHCMCMRLL